MDQQDSFWEKVLRWGIVLMVAVLPLLYFPWQGPVAYITTKQYFFSGFVDIVGIVWLWIMARDTRYRLSRKNILALVPLFLFLVALTISSIFGIDPATSFFSTFEIGTGMILLWHIFLFICMTASVVRVHGKDVFKKIVQSSLCAAVILVFSTYLAHGVFHVHTKMLDGSTGGAMMGNVLLAAAYMIFVIFFGIMLLVQESSSKKKWIYGIALAIIILSPEFFLTPFIWSGVNKLSIFSHPLLIVGDARIATAAMVLGLFFALFSWIGVTAKKHTGRTVGWAGVIGVVVLTILMGWQCLAPNGKLHSFFLATSGSRIDFWQESIAGIKSRPILGWGQDNYRVIYWKYLPEVTHDYGTGDQIQALHPHNAWLEILNNGGIVGFILYITVLVSLVVMIINLYRKQILGPAWFALLLGLLFAYVVQDQMIYDSITSLVMVFTLVGILAGLNDRSDAQPIHSGVISKWLALFGSVALIIVWVFVAYLPAHSVKKFMGLVNEPTNIRAAQYSSIFTKTGSYAIDTDISYVGLPLASAYYRILNTTLKASPENQTLSFNEVQSLVNAADPIWQKRVSDYGLSIMLARLENLSIAISGKPDSSIIARAEAYEKRGIELSPNNAQIHVAAAQTYAYAGNINQSRSELEKALTIDPGYPDAKFFKASFEQVTGEKIK